MIRITANSPAAAPRTLNCGMLDVRCPPKRSGTSSSVKMWDFGSSIRSSASRDRSKLKTAHPEREVEPFLGLYRQRLQNKRAFEAANQYVGPDSDASRDTAASS